MRNTGKKQIPDLERQIQQQENVLSILLGENPQSIPRGRPLTEQPVPQNVPAGLPSELLERRPDVRQVEEMMVAANAQIGVAKASFFPNLSLTGLGGLESNALHQFVTQRSEVWYGAFSVSQPVFQGGALRSQLRLARANWQEAVLSCEIPGGNAPQENVTVSKENGFGDTVITNCADWPGVRLASVGVADNVYKDRGASMVWIRVACVWPTY
jgi:hypothetical protein